MILSHFEDREVTNVGGTDRCCDNCTLKRAHAAAQDAGISMAGFITEETRDFTKELHILLGAIRVQ